MILESKNAPGAVHFTVHSLETNAIAAPSQKVHQIDNNKERTIRK